MSEQPLVLSWDDESGTAQYMVFDAVESVQHNSTVETTSYPTQSGAPMSDHAFNLPDTLAFSALVSNTPLPSNDGVGEASRYTTQSARMAPEVVELNIPQKPLKPGQFLGPGGVTRLGVGAIEGAIQGAQQNRAKVYVAQQTFDRINETRDTLRGAMRTFKRMRVTTRRGSYRNMLVRALAVPDSTESDTACTFQVALSETLTASLLTVEAPVPAEPRGKPPAAATKSPKPAKNATEKAEKIEGQRESLAHKLKGQIGALFG